MKKQPKIKLVLTCVIIIYLLIGLGIETYSDYKSNQNEGFLEGLARDNGKYSPSHLLSILLWPFYI